MPVHYGVIFTGAAIAMRDFQRGEMVIRAKTATLINTNAGKVIESANGALPSISAVVVNAE